MLKKTFLSLSCALALGAVAAPAFASPKFFLVVPLAASTQAQEPVEAITISLAGAALPKATVNQAYSESLRPYLSVTGDADFDSSAARWSLAEGTLPAGLSLDETTGAVAGTPTAKTTGPASFTVLAGYKDADGQAVYTIEVGGEALNVSKISSGEYHSCAITDTGGVKCWGYNSSGQLGDNSTTQRLTPVDVVGLGSGVASVSAGSNFTCAVTTSGAAKCWGGNGSGRLGDNSTTNRLTPVDVVGLSSGVASIAAGGNHTCAVMSSGAAKCWGDNYQGQVGDNSSTTRRTPVDVVGLESGVSSISAALAHTCAVTTTGAAKCWGYNANGQLGINSTTTRLAPADVVGLGSGVASLSAGHYHTCALMTSGAVKCWGFNDYGQLGNNSTASRNFPVDVAGLNSGVASITTGHYHTCALTTSGTVKCWGNNGYGRLGDGSTINRLTPSNINGLSDVIALAGGGSHTCSMTAERIMTCWGYNYYGQLGNNSKVNSPVPLNVQGVQ